MRKLVRPFRLLVELAVALTLAAPALAQSPAPALPLLTSYAMEPDRADPQKLVDSGPLGLNGRLTEGVSFVAGGRKGQALHFSGTGENIAKVGERKLLDQVGAPFTLALWLKAEAPAADGTVATIITKREGWWAPTPFSLSLGGGDGALLLDTNNGKDGSSGGRVLHAYKVGEWVHVAITFQPNGERVWYLNGEPVNRAHLEGTLAANDQPLIFGYEKGGDFPGGGRSKFRGLLDEVHLYAAALTAEQVKDEMNGAALPTRAPVAADFAKPSHYVKLALVRWDMPLGFRGRISRTRETAKRVPGPDAVDWPVLSLNGKKIFEQSAEEASFFPLRQDPERRPLFHQRFDDICTVQPGEHWFRAVEWLWGRRYIYTTDRTARGAERDFEIWTFPVTIRGAGEAEVKDVILRGNGQTLYENAGPFRSLTLLLPQNLPDQPYELSVAGRAPVTFNAGLEQVKLGDPVERPLAINLTLPGGTSPITVRNLDHPAPFPNAKEWDEDLKLVAATRAASEPGAMVKSPLAAPFVYERKVKSFPDYVGVEVPRSPLAIHTVNMTHGMSGGHFYGSEHGPGAFNGGGAFPGTVDDYAKYLAALGYDRAFERVNDGIPAPQDARSYEHWLAALAERGVQGGLNIVALNDANLPFYSYALPDFNRPRERDAQLVVQRFSRFPNLAGASMGADNAGYAPYWDWAPATPERPWGEAFIQFQGDRPPKAPVPPGMKADKDYEYPTPSMRQFVDYITRYDESFKRYGHFARAVQEVNPRLAFATQSFGSSPGVGAHGGYRWASIPGQPMHDGVPILQSYDWDETTAAKPLHNVALLDRLRSYYPEKPAWALLDDFMLKYGREPRQRAFALALTRGLQSIGPNWLAHTEGKFARPQIAANEQELYAWCHRFGGAYAMTEPLPSIGVLYVHLQAVARRSDAKDPQSPHEGKTTEALFFSHAAGWPAKIVTPEELKRGLPASMKALLLVGLNKIDDSWHWSDGIEKELGAFVQKGGRLLLDDESAVPAGLPAVKTDMAVRAYVAQGDGTTDIAATMDKTPVLIERNGDNIAKLRQAMAGVAEPFATSADPTIWAIPTLAGDVQYLTVVNQGSEPGKNATEVMKPQTGRLTWKTERPIYDVRRGRKISAAEAATVDLTKEGFQWFALPPGEVTAPQLTLAREADGFYSATVAVGEQPMRGVPVQLTVTRGGETATVYAASGRPARLPLNETDAGDYTVTATELLTNLSATAPVTMKGGPAASAAPASAAVARFGARHEVPLTIALTPEQAADGAFQGLVKQAVAAFAAAGRPAEVRTIEPNGVVLSLQPTNAAQPFPRWRTIESDLVLLGSPADNLLLFDEARGELLPPAALDPAKAGSGTAVTFSPFVGGYHALNIYGHGPAQLAAELAKLPAALAP